MRSNVEEQKKIQAVLTAATKGIRALSSTVPALVEAAEIIRKREGDILVTGIGKSGFIAQKCAATLTSLGNRAFYIHPTEALHGDVGALSSRDVLIALSFSGESKEVASIARYAKRNFNVQLIVLSKTAHSTLGKLADCHIPVPVEKEGSPDEMAPMASTSMTLILCDMLAAALVEKSFRQEHFAKNHPGGSLGLRLRKVKTLMNSGSAVPRVRESDSFLDALNEMTAKKLGVTAVTDARGAVTGAVTDGDIRRFVLKKKSVEAAKAKDAMTAKPKCIGENETLEAALVLMEAHKITSLFVTAAKNKLVGVIHLHQILEEVV